MPEKKIVVVDDDESIRKTFFLLLSEKYNVYLARDAGEALARFEKAQVDMIIADLRLPQKDGLQMAFDFRKSGYKGRIILISACADQVRPEDLEKLGVDRLFIKPLDLSLLTETIDLLLSGN
ncbi:MAG: response regulator [Candidatus Saccharicenans sp.]|nr:response regulator [Candidatus Saccharicenans sp.]MDI6849740.1 response regulator [Candidatus Saccharicenans sp.]